MSDETAQEVIRRLNVDLMKARAHNAALVKRECESQQRITELENGLVRREAELDQIDTRNEALMHRIAELTEQVNELEIENCTLLEMAHEAMWNHVGFDDRVVRSS